MQIGEAIAAVLAWLTGSGPSTTELDAELQEVTFDASKKTCLGGSEVRGPHWKAGEDPTHAWRSQARGMGLPAGPYSKKPAVYLVKGASGAKHTVELKVKVTKSEGVSGNGTLVGKLGALEIKGSCPVSAGDHTVSATISNPPDELAVHRGNVIWELQASGKTVPLGTSLVELYFVLDAPTATYRRKGVWAEVLRFLFGRVRVSGDDQDAIAARVTRYCHGSHRLRYDTRRGAPAYFDAGGFTVRIGDYLRRSHPRANCYDQASAVQAFCGAVGITQSWLFLNPFGYINPANLLGVGMCNNPFFDGNGSQPVVADLSPQRTAFGNHAFVGHSSKILDACAGPHTGNEDAAAYVKASIDDNPALYGPGQRPGTAGDIQNFGPIQAV